MKKNEKDMHKTSTVLVVDDEKDIREVFREVLENQGYEVETSGSFLEAKKLIQARSFDAVLADIFLGQMDGIELLKKIKELQPDTPVILFTGYPSLETASEAVRLDAYDYLQKPVMQKTLINATKRAVETKKLREDKKRIERENKKYQEDLESLVEERTRQLMESEERYRSFFEESRDAIYITTRDEKFIDVNRSTLDLFGYRREEMLNLNKRDLYVNRADYIKFKKEIEQEGFVRDYETILRKKDNTEIDCLVTSTVRRDRSGRIEEYQGIIRDITASKRAREDLALRDAVLEAVGFAAEQFLKETDWEQNINNVLERLGKAANVSRVYIYENSIGQDGTLLMNQRYEWAAPGIESQIDNTKLQGLSYQKSGFDRWEEMILRGEIISGHVKDFPKCERKVLEPQGITSMIVVPIFIGQSCWGFIGVDEFLREREWSLAEIDALKVASGTLGAALHHKQQAIERLRLVTAIEQSVDGVIITNSDGIIQYVNPAFENITGYKKDEIIGQYPGTLKSGHHDSDFDRTIWETIKKGNIWHGHLINKKKDGSQYEEEATISPVKSASGEIVNYVVVMRDITEKKRFESIAETANLMDNLGYIFSGIRHELGNPINSIKMTLSVLDKNIETFSRETAHEFLDRSLKQINRVEYLLWALRNFSIFESPKLQNTQMHAFMEKFLHLLLDDFKKKGITVKTMFSPDAKWGLTDPRTLHQVMLNLLSNAAHALNGREAPQILISLARKPGLILIDVQDNGCGISKEQQENLFKPFFTTKPQGTGLGLVIVKKMLTKMNSTIDIESHKDKGTKVRISIPEEGIDSS